MIYKKAEVIQKEYRRQYLKKITEFETNYDKKLYKYLDKIRKTFFDNSNASGEIKQITKNKVKLSLKVLNNWLEIETENILEGCISKSLKIAVLGQLKTLQYVLKHINKTDNLSKYRSNLEIIKNEYSSEKIKGIKNYIWKREWEDNLNIDDRLTNLNNKHNREINAVVNSDHKTVSAYNEIENAITNPAVQSYKYNILRLALTETNSGYRYVQKQIGEKSNLVEGIKWNLSASHPKYDYLEICERYALKNHSGIGTGVYRPQNLPKLPHPNCLCYLTYFYKNNIILSHL